MDGLQGEGMKALVGALVYTGVGEAFQTQSSDLSSVPKAGSLGGQLDSTEPVVYPRGRGEKMGVWV